MLTWKTHNDGKNHGNPQAAEYTKREDYNNGSTRAMTYCTSLVATRGGYNGGNYLSLVLSLSHALSLHTHYTTNFTKCNNLYIICVP